ncbi:MAG: type II secretion system minor pseudopilin GspI [Pseudomonadota bacterium]
MIPRPTPSAPNDAGFTLVEVLAALAVFSVAALGLVQVSLENTRTARTVEMRALASLVADNRLAEALTRPEPLELGVQTDGLNMGGRSWQVRETVQRTPNPVIHEVVVDVSLVETARDPRPILTVRAFSRAQNR